MDPVIILQAFGDNYIYLYRDGQGDAFVVDPGESKVVLEALKKHQLNLQAALITHHHFDHTGGVDELKKYTGCVVWQPQAKLGDGDVVEICGAKIQVITTPGHTRDSVCYYFRPNEEHRGIVFTGDTLFIGGCGRIIEADGRTMWQSLQKIASLPDETLVYPGHDYTLENYQFATQTVPKYQALKHRLQEIENLQSHDFPTVPSTIAQEKATNIFLLAYNPEIKAAADLSNAPNAEVFVHLRKLKDIFIW